MKILHVTDLHFYLPWFATLNDWSKQHDCVVISGDSLSHLISPQVGSCQERYIKTWIINAHLPVFYSCGGFDPQDMAAWNLPNLRLAGTHFLKGWRVDVLDAYGRRQAPEHSEDQTIIVSHYPPAETRCGTGMNGEEFGSHDVRKDVEELGNVRLVLCGRCHDPLSHTDFIGDAMIVNPALSFFEHRVEPAFASINCETRSVTLFDGRRLTTHSFAK